jgi:hypothetical protein
MPKNPLSRHLAADAALDAGRGVISLTEDVGMWTHIDSCDLCRSKVNRWRSFAIAAGRHGEVDPPGRIVGRAKALGHRHPRVTGPTQLKAVLHYDHAWIPLPAGVRGASRDQVVYQVEEYAVELRVSHERSRQMVIVGQISNRRQPAKRLANVPVILLVGDRVVVRASSNARGEFHLEHDERDPMWIEIAPEEGRSIRIPLRPKQMAS